MSGEKILIIKSFMAYGSILSTEGSEEENSLLQTNSSFLTGASILKQRKEVLDED